MRQILVTLIAGWAIWADQLVECWQTKSTLCPPRMDAAAEWPTPTNVSRPWTRWWWLGSAVDAENLTRLLETYHAAGLGGVEITSIYGVQGADDRELPFLSKAWVDALRHAVREAKRLGMGVDLPTGSGWRTGGPSVTDEDANLEAGARTRSRSKSGSDVRSAVRRDAATSTRGATARMARWSISRQIATTASVAWQVPRRTSGRSTPSTSAGRKTT